MSHEIAELTKGGSKLGGIGILVNIRDVERTYGTADAAKADASFQCADCRIPVVPVIPAPHKAARKRSPSPYFRATTQHRAGCTRLPVLVPPAGPTAREMAARPARAPSPTDWRDAPPTGAGPVTSTPGKTAGGPPSDAGLGARVTQPGIGASQRSSVLVETFARAYVNMTPGIRTTAPLKAPWNPGGTYGSAFVGIDAGSVTSAQPPERIYFGEIESVFKGRTGFILTLSHRHADGKELRIWLQDVITTTPAPGPQLWARLTSGQIKKGMAIFALGAFKEQTPSGNQPNYYSLPVVDAHRVWITEI